MKHTRAGAMLPALLSAAALSTSLAMYQPGWITAAAAAEHDSGHATSHDSSHETDHAAGHDSEHEGSGGKGPKYQGGRDQAHGGYDVEHKVFTSGDPGEDESQGPMHRGGEGSHRPEGGKQGRPGWAQEGLPTSELGRLSMSRAPQQVLDRQLNEALASYELAPADMAAFYNQPLAAIVAELSSSDTYLTAARLDSPGQNLALLQELMADGHTQLAGVTSENTGDLTRLGAVFLGTASDKSMAVTTAVAESVLIILGVRDSAATLGVNVESLAQQADEVRAAIASGHGE